MILKCQDLVLKVSIQAQTLKAFTQNYFKESCFKGLKFLTEHSWKFIKDALGNQTFPSLISSSFVCEEMTQMLKILKIKKLLSHFLYYRFIFFHLQVHYFNTFFHIHFMDKYRWILSFTGPCFVFNFKSKKSISCF